MFPEEIDRNIILLDTLKTTNTVSFIGTPTPETDTLSRFCHDQNLHLIVKGGALNEKMSVKDNQDCIQESIIAPSLQSEWQVEHGYIPCRIFKNISYGKMGITNNAFVNELFDHKLLYDSDVTKCLSMGLDFERNVLDKKQQLVPLMEFVKEKHTYLNRIETILKFLGL